jgi:hypothetical protein
LRAVYGETAGCERDACPFWNRLDSSAAGDGPVCTLEHFGLIGTHGERLSRWFLDLKERDARQHQPLVTLKHA